MAGDSTWRDHSHFLGIIGLYTPDRLAPYRSIFSLNSRHWKRILHKKWREWKRIWREWKRILQKNPKLFPPFLVHGLSQESKESSHNFVLWFKTLLIFFSIFFSNSDNNVRQQQTITKYYFIFIMNLLLSNEFIMIDFFSYIEIFQHKLINSALIIFLPVKLRNH